MPYQKIWRRTANGDARATIGRLTLTSEALGGGEYGWRVFGADDNEMLRARRGYDNELDCRADAERAANELGGADGARPLAPIQLSRGTAALGQPPERGANVVNLDEYRAR